MAEKLLTVSPNTPIAEAVELCHLKHIRHLPVVDGDRLVGIVSDRDLRGALGSQRPETMPVAQSLVEIVHQDAAHVATGVDQDMLAAIALGDLAQAMVKTMEGPQVTTAQVVRLSQ